MLKCLLQEAAASKAAAAAANAAAQELLQEEAEQGGSAQQAPALKGAKRDKPKTAPAVAGEIKVFSLRALEAQWWGH